MCEKVVVVFQHEIGQKKRGVERKRKKIPKLVTVHLYRRNNIGHYLPSGSLTHIGLYTPAQISRSDNISMD